MEWNFIQQPSNVTVRRKDSVTLTCRPRRSRPPAQVSWFKNNRLMNPMPHISLQSNGDLLFHRVQDKDRGIYFCRASIAHLFRAVSSRKVYLNVLDPPSLEIWPVMVTATLGSKVRFQCQVYGNPPPSITWSKQGWSVLTGGKVTIGVKNATLYLSSVKSYDEGLYTCEASNVVGRAQGTASLRMAAEADPGGFTAGDGEEVPVAINNSAEQKSNPRHQQDLLERMESAIKSLKFPETTSLPRKFSVASSVTLDLQSSLGKENSAPPAAQNLLHVMESRPFLFPSLNADWTSSGLGDSLKNLEGLVLKTERLAGTEAFYVPLYTRNMAPQSSLDEVMPGANTEPSTISTTQLLIGSHFLSPDHHSSPSNFYFSPPDDNKFLPHIPYSLSVDTDTFPCQSQALSPEPQSQPPDLHSQPPGHEPPPHSPSLSEEDWIPTSTAEEQNGNQPTSPAENHEIQLTDCPKRNTSQPPMRNSDGINSVMPESYPWLPALEKHDIPIVVGVGVSLIFIFITMAFYSLVQKNEPAPIGRAAQRNFRGHSGHPETRRTYENRAFENDVVDVTEQNPNTRTTVLLPSTNSVTMVMEPASDTSTKRVQLTQGQITTAEPDPEPETGHPQDIDYCVDGECGQCQDAYNPPPHSIRASQEEGINTFLTLQTAEPCGTPIHHSVSISHSSTPLLLSHCVSLGVTTVSVDVHYYPPHSASSPFTSTAPELSGGSQLAQSQTAPKLLYGEFQVGHFHNTNKCSNK
ncbi:uncharacterized protein LOC118206456 isoform X3 [Anguilla anguilla]|nr:uncharacterized protein LOC118206456 isoform X3 [Anguilla anguilla]